MSTSTRTTVARVESQIPQALPRNARPEAEILGHGRASVKRFTKLDLSMARLKGESAGRTMGRVDERRLIVAWLRTITTGNPAQLAGRIENNDHHRDDVLYPEELDHV
jgi:hypothetical protein